VIQIARRRDLPAVFFKVEERTRGVDISNLNHFRGDGVYRRSNHAADRCSGPGSSLGHAGSRLCLYGTALDPLLAPLKDERQECLLIGVDQKGPTDGQSDAVDPKPT
jgi:hypothetical protein